MITFYDFGEGVASGAVLVLVAGQSNSRAYATTGSDVPLDLQTPDAGILVWNTHTAAWEGYETGVNSDTWTSGASTPQKWGPEAGFAYAFRAANPTTELRIVKLSVDATRLYADSGDDWNPSSTGELFDDMTTEITAALAAWGGSATGSVLLWMQGEADAQNATYGNAYGPSLTDFITAVRAEWGDAGTEIVLGRVTSSEELLPQTNSVRAFQTRVARDVANVTAVDTDGYTLDVDDKHYVAASIQTMGEDMYDAYAGAYTLIPPRFEAVSTDINSSISLTNDRRTIEGGGTTSSARQSARADFFLSGLCYWEVLVDLRTANLGVGVGRGFVKTDYWGQHADDIGYFGDGNVNKNNAVIATYATYTAGDRVMVAFDSTTGKVWFGKNGTWNGDPAAGTGQATTLSATTSTSYHRMGATMRRSGDKVTLKTEAADFAYSPPSGFAAI